MAVFLVGAGIGDPYLLTRRGEALLKRAEVVVHDRLIDSRLLQLAPSDARIVDVGKGREESQKQQLINEMLVDLGRRYQRVVRLKGGDPFVFGRAVEEIAALAQARVPFRVVPGISSATGVAAVEGIALTQRGGSRGFAVLTASPAGILESLDERELSYLFLMSSASSEEIRDFLLKKGFDEHTPVHAVSWASTWRAKSVSCEVKDLHLLRLPPPLTVIAGRFSKAFADPAHSGPLKGWRIALLRAKGGFETEQVLWELGAEPRTFVSARLREVKESAHALCSMLAEANAVLFSSSEAVEVFFSLLEQSGLDARALHNKTVLSVGTATSSSLLAHRISPDLTASGKGLSDLIRQGGSILKGDGVLLHPCGNLTNKEELEGQLAALGVRYAPIEVYENQPVGVSKAEAEELLLADLLVFFSPSSINALGPEVLQSIKQKPAVAIGPTTEAALASAGLKAVVRAESPRPEHIAQAAQSLMEGLSSQLPV